MRDNLGESSDLPAGQQDNYPLTEEDPKSDGEEDQTAEKYAMPCAAETAASACSLEKAYRDGAKEGFKLRGSKVGKLWYKYLKKEPELAKAYKNVSDTAGTGTLHEAQRKFRTRWCEERAESYKAKRENVQERSKGNQEFGEYETLQRIIYLERDQQTAVKYAMNCVRMHKAGTTFQGVPMVRWSKMRETRQFLYLKERYHSGFEELWREIVEREAKQPEEEVEAKPFEEATPKKKAAQPPKKALPEVPQTPRKGKFSDAVEKDLQHLVQLKKKYNSVHASADDLLNIITTNDAWDWARPADKLKRLMAELVEWRNKSAFWQVWAVGDFARVRSTVVEDSIVESLQLKPQLAQHLQNLELELSMLKAMKASRDATAEKAAGSGRATTKPK